MNQLSKELHSLDASRQELIEASRQLQALQEQNQEYALILSQANAAAEASNRLASMLAVKLASKDKAQAQLKASYEEQQATLQDLAGQLEAAHERIAELQKGRL